MQRSAAGQGHATLASTHGYPCLWVSLTIGCMRLCCLCHDRRAHDGHVGRKWTQAPIHMQFCITVLCHDDFTRLAVTCGRRMSLSAVILLPCIDTLFNTRYQCECRNRCAFFSNHPGICTSYAAHKLRYHQSGTHVIAS